jgi:hypothetical protein
MSVPRKLDPIPITVFGGGGPALSFERIKNRFIAPAVD